MKIFLFCRLQTAFHQQAAFVQNGMSDRNNMGIDPLEIAQQIQME